MYFKYDPITIFDNSHYIILYIPFNVFIHSPDTAFQILIVLSQLPLTIYLVSYKYATDVT